MTSPKKEFLHKEFDKVKPVAYGSIREKKVNPDLQEERAKCNFDRAELTQVIYGNNVDLHKDFIAFFEKRPHLQTDFSFYEMTREEMLERGMKVLKEVASSKESI